MKFTFTASAEFEGEQNEAEGALDTVVSLWSEGGLPLQPLFLCYLKDIRILVWSLLVCNILIYYTF